MFSEWSQPYPFCPPGMSRENTLLLQFREGTARNDVLSEGGAPVYDRVFQVQVQAIGQKNSAPIFTLEKITQGVSKYPERRQYDQFREPYDAWRKNMAPSMDGVPLEQWPLMTMDLVRAFKDANIYTVEQLAGVQDNGLQNVRAEGYAWRAKAKAWLDQSRKAGEDTRARADLAKAEKRIADLEAQVKAMLASQNTTGFKKGKRSAPLEDDMVASVETFEDDMALDPRL